MLLALQLTILLGIDGVPLACVGTEGYIARGLLDAGIPFVVVVLVIGIGWQGCSTRSGISSLEATCRARSCSTGPHMPSYASAFLAYPIVTNVAFAAFSCFKFKGGAGYLKADVT